MIEKKIACLAVDDEPPALEVIKNHIAFIPALELAGTCLNAVSAHAFLQKKQIDLLFLDIQMPHLLGTDFVRTLKHPPKVIFTTAYRNFALEGFELNAVDYLLKPISFERFLQAINKVLDIKLERIELGGNHHNTSQIPEQTCMHLRANRKTVKINFAEILYIESLKDYLRIITDSKIILSKYTLNAVAELLPKSSFLRIHRSYIVAISRIDAYSSEIVQIGKHEIPISRSYRHETEKALKAE